MRSEVIAYVDRVLDGCPFKGRVLDVGSYDVNGTVRPVFERRGWTYLGADMAAGPNVDVVCPVDRLIGHPQIGRDFDAVVSCESLEHIESMIAAVDVLRALVRPGGLLILTAAGNGFPEHKHPVDCWRVLPDGMRFLLRGFERVDLFDKISPAGICGSGYKR